MRDYISIGPAPCDEDCVQVTKDGDYVQAQRKECQEFIALIRRHLGEEPPGARLKVKGFAHDFGQYYEVVCEYDCGDEKAVDYAFKCETSAPTNWDWARLVPEAKIEGNTAICNGLLAEQIAALVKSPYFVGIFPHADGLRLKFK